MQTARFQLEQLFRSVAGHQPEPTIWLRAPAPSISLLCAPARCGVVLRARYCRRRFTLPRHANCSVSVGASLSQCRRPSAETNNLAESPSAEHFTTLRSSSLWSCSSRAVLSWQIHIATTCKLLGFSWTNSFAVSQAISRNQQFG